MVFSDIVTGIRVKGNWTRRPQLTCAFAFAVGYLHSVYLRSTICVWTLTEKYRTEWNECKGQALGFNDWAHFWAVQKPCSPGMHQKVQCCWHVCLKVPHLVTYRSSLCTYSTFIYGFTNGFFVVFQLNVFRYYLMGFYQWLCIFKMLMSLNSHRN